MLKNKQHSLMNSVLTGAALFLIFLFPLGNATAETISVRYQDTTFEVNASLTNGSVKSITVEEDFTSIVLDVETDTDQEGVLTITLPRALIDARNGNSDGQFIVVVESGEVEYSEDGTTDTERVLNIAVPSGTTRIEIVGTQVVPEFPISFVSIGVALIFALLVLSGRTKLLNKFGQI